MFQHFAPERSEARQAARFQEAHLPGRVGQEIFGIPPCARRGDDVPIDLVERQAHVVRQCRTPPLPVRKHDLALEHAFNP